MNKKNKHVGAILLETLRAELVKVADPRRAPQMQAYMKSAMPYHGVSSPIFKKVCKAVFKDIDLPNAKRWESHVLHLWRNAAFREERYGALFLAGHSHAKAYQTVDAMNLYEEMIVTGAWWDYVDDIATHRVGEIVRSYPRPMQRLMRQWSKAPNLWKRRTSILCQIGSKEETDLQLLYECIEPSIGSDEFFLRKAIGWSLRQVAWRNPEAVIQYVKKNRGRLSPLSKREALKNLIKSGKVRAVP